MAALLELHMASILLAQIDAVMTFTLFESG